MPETLSTRSKGHYSTNPVFHYIAYNDLNVEAIRQDAYLRGHVDGAKDMQIELLKRGKALFHLALQKVTEITTDLIEAAEKSSITIYDFHLKMEDWDKVSSLIVVGLEDYVDDKIDLLYHQAKELADAYNDDAFHWDYSITYSSATLNREKILTDGFTHLYEHTAKPRQTQ